MKEDVTEYVKQQVDESNVIKTDAYTVTLVKKPEYVFDDTEYLRLQALYNDSAKKTESLKKTLASAQKKLISEENYSILDTKYEIRVNV